MKHILIPQNFKYPDIKPEDHRLGSVSVGEILRPDRDWRAFLPPQEEQRRNGIESSACYIHGLQHAIATILEEKYEVIDQDFSERFNTQLSGATEDGGDPLKGAQSIRHDGLIPGGMLPFSDEIKSFEEFNSFKGSDEKQCRAEGKKWLSKWSPRWKIVFEKNDSIAAKYAKLKDALKKSPVPVSVYAWVEDDNGLYIKPEGETDNHLVECVFVDADNYPWIWDTYPPFLKKLEKNFDFDFGMSWTVDKLTDNQNKSVTIEPSWLKSLLKKLCPS